MIPIGDVRICEFLKDDNYSKKIDTYNKKFLTELKTISLDTLNVGEVKFLLEVINYFETENFLSVKPENAISTLKKAPSIKIKNLIVEKSNYTGLREDFFPEFFNFLGIKICVYCHSQLAITFKKQDKKFKALLEADHYHSKSLYPYLSISLYNLYPVCASCNRNKGKKKIYFELYSNEKPKENIEFRIKDKSIIEDLLNFSATKLELEILYNDDYIKRFYLKEIYNSQVDIIEELVYKSRVYNETYRDNLKTYGIDDDTINRFVVGNYTSENDIYKRPLAKMMTDIAKDLELIK